MPDTSDIDLDDVASFRKIFGLPAGTAPKIVVANGIDPGQCLGPADLSYCSIDDRYENSLDVEWSGAVAKGASIVLVVSGQPSATTDTVFTSAQYVVQNQTAKILSVSYGECELGLGTAGNAAYNNLWETAATEGIAVFVASGDAGSATCDQGQAQSLPYMAQFGLSVSGMASTPYDTAVGGTDLNWGTTASPYWQTYNLTNGDSALGYVPEIPWNDTCTNPVVLPILQEWATTLSNSGYSPTSPTDAESACNFASQWDTAVFNGTNGEVESGCANRHHWRGWRREQLHHERRLDRGQLHWRIRQASVAGRRDRHPCRRQARSARRVVLCRQRISGVRLPGVRIG